MSGQPSNPVAETVSRIGNMLTAAATMLQQAPASRLKAAGAMMLAVGGPL